MAGQRKNTTDLATELSKILKEIINKVDDITMTQFIAHRSQTLINEIQLNEMAAKGTDMVMAQNGHTHILNYLIA